MGGLAFPSLDLLGSDYGLGSESGSQNVSGVPVTLPGGITGTYTGDPSLFPEINDANGNPVAISPARPSSSSSPLGTALQSIVEGTPAAAPVGALLGGFGGAVATGANALGFGTGSHDISDYAAIVVGLILIAAGLFMFKQTQDVISTGVGHARRAGETIAAVAA